MKEKFGLIRRGSGIFYVRDKSTGQQTSLRTRVKSEGLRMVQAYNEANNQPQLNAALARIYAYGSDPDFGIRTWQNVMDHIVEHQRGTTRTRWKTAIKDEAFDSIRRLKVTETRPEHFFKVLMSETVATNVFLRRIHNHALDMDWLLRPVLPKRAWPTPVYEEKRAITYAEHKRIIKKEINPERRDFYELLWHTGASQGDAASLNAEDVNWDHLTICYSRHKLKSRGSGMRPALIRFGTAVKAILKRRPKRGPLFPTLIQARPGDRATEFRDRCDRRGVHGVTLHSYRYAWAERALKCGYPERFAQQALGHNSKAVHYAYAKGAEVTVPSLDDWEREWKKSPQRSKKPTIVPIDFSRPQRVNSSVTHKKNPRCGKKSKAG